MFLRTSPSRFNIGVQEVGDLVTYFYNFILKDEK